MLQRNCCRMEFNHTRGFVCTFLPYFVQGVCREVSLVGGSGRGDGVGWGGGGGWGGVGGGVGWVGWGGVGWGGVEWGGVGWGGGGVGGWGWVGGGGGGCCYHGFQLSMTFLRTLGNLKPRIRTFGILHKGQDPLNTSVLGRVATRNNVQNAGQKNEMH